MTPEERMQSRTLSNSSLVNESAPMSDEELESRAVAAMQLKGEAQQSLDNEVVQSQEEWKDRANFFGAVLDNEFWVNDIPRSARTTAGNLAAMTAGFPSDMASLIASAGTMHMAAEPGSAEERRSDLFEEYSDPRMVPIPGMSDDLIEPFGGSREHLSYWPTALLAPGPGELMTGGKAMMVGAIAASRAPQKLGKLSEFLAKGDVPKFDQKAWQETGWYKGDDGQPRFFLSDAGSSIRKDFMDNHWTTKQMKSSFEADGKPMSGRIVTQLQDVWDHPDLFEVYPEIAKMRITLNTQYGPNGLTIGLPASSRVNKGTKASQEWATSDMVDGITMFRTDDISVDLMREMAHEVQHVVQSIERFATGGNTRVDWAALDRIQGAEALEETFNLIDSGITGVDDLYKSLVQRGVEAPQAQKIITNRDTQRYLAGGDLFRNELRTAMAGERARDYNNVGFVLEYMFADEERVPQGLKLLKRIEEELQFVDVQQLAHRSYENLYGEAEARLTSDLIRVSKEAVDEIDDVQLFEPAFASRANVDDEGKRLYSTPSDQSAKVAEYNPSTAGIPRTGTQGIKYSSEINRNRGGVDGGGLDIPGDYRDITKDNITTARSRRKQGDFDFTDLPEGTDKIEDLTDPSTLPDTMSASLSRGLDMEKGHNIVKVPVSGGRLGNAKVDILKNPSKREIQKLAQRNDVGAFRTFRTEDGDLFVWDGMSEALHADMEKYLGIKTTGKDWSDRASASDVLEMIAGNWYGNDF